MSYTIIYHYFNEVTAEHEWKLDLDGRTGFLVLDDMEVTGQNTKKDRFFNKYSNYIAWE